MATRNLAAKPQFGLPSAQCVARLSSAEQVERLRSLNFDYEVKMRDLENQYEARADALRTEYIESILAVHNNE
jgi:hypothetical protein